MIKQLSAVFAAVCAFAVPALANVSVQQPTNGATVSTAVPYAATSSSTCRLGVAAMGIYVDNQLQYVTPGSTINTTLKVAQGTHNTVVEEWDYCGGATYASEQINVANGGVNVSSPANGATVAPATYYAASSSSSCSQGVASMGVYVDNNLTYVSEGPVLNTTMNLPSGSHHTVVEAWDRCGGASYQAVDVNVSQGTSLSNLQASQGWVGYGEYPPLYNICAGPCPGINWSTQQGVSNPSLSGNATRFSINGTVPYADVLWTNPLIGDNSSQGIRDRNHKLLPSIHHYSYDTYVFVTNWDITQALEFDISMYMNGAGMIWGSQCDHLADGAWDIWDNTHASWVSTGIPCQLQNNAWNHITINVERDDQNNLTYDSIAVNGNTSNLNIKYPPFSVPNSWWGVTSNYQMDGNWQEASNTTYVDNFTLSYW